MKFKIGQKVECFRRGKGYIEEVINRKDYPYRVLFESGRVEIFTEDLKENTSDIRPSLTLGTWKVEEILPEPEFEKGQPVWVKNLEEEEWRLRYYHMYTNNQHYAFFDQKIENTESSYPWNYIKPFEGTDPND